MKTFKHAFLPIAVALGIILLFLAIPQAVLAQEQAQSSAAYVTMYRLYNPNSGEHLYTKDSNEVSVLTKIGWKKEGEAWKAASSGQAVYRLYNPNNGDHHYTLDSNEYNSLGKIGWRKEGVAWFSDKNKGVAVYRLYNPSQTEAGSHHYTTDKNEYSVLKTKGWRQEGIAWYGVKVSSSSSSTKTTTTATTTTTTTPKTNTTTTTTTTPKTNTTTTTTPKTNTTTTTTTTTTPKTDSTTTTTTPKTNTTTTTTTTPKTDSTTTTTTTPPKTDSTTTTTTTPKTNTTTTTKTTPKNKYTYELYTTASKLYTDYGIPVFIKTDNPDRNNSGKETFTLRSDKGISIYTNRQYDDVKYLDDGKYSMDWNGQTTKVQSDYYKVEGGYLITIGFSEPGTYTLSITETIDETVTGLGKVTVTVLDTDEYADQWQYSVINQVTTSKMDSFEKMEAVSNYLLNNFKYLKNDGNSHLITSVTDAGLPYFVTKEWDSYISPAVLSEFAEKIGGFDKIHDCYNDYSRGSAKWQDNHYYVECTIGSVTKRYKACPGTHTNVITNISQINLINSNLLRKL